MPSKKVKIALAGGAAAGLLAVVSFGPLVRHEVGSTAERYGAEVVVDGVRPAWGGARLRGVDVTLPEVPAAQIHFDEVEVHLGSPRRVVLRGGSVTAVGPRAEVVRQVEAWRAKHTSTGGGTGASTETDLEDLAVDWKDDATSPIESLKATGVRLERAGASTRIGAAEATLVEGAATIVARDAKIALVRETVGYRVAELVTAGLDVELRLPAPPPRSEASPDDDPEGVPDLPEDTSAPHARGQRPARRTGSTAARDGGPRPAAPAPGQDTVRAASDAGAALAAKALRARGALVRAAAVLDAALEPDARIELAGVHARVTRGGETLNLGPGTLAVRRSPERLEVELSPNLGETKNALTFRLAVPLRDVDRGEVVADVRGGPIWLSAIGVREGDVGLLDVARTSLETTAHLVLSPDARRLRVEGDGKVHNLSLRNAALSDEPVSGLELAWRGKGEIALDLSHASIEDGELDLGAIRAVGHGEYDRTSTGHRVRADFELPLAACQSMLESIPKGLVPRLAGMRMAGSFAIMGHARFDTANLDRDFDLGWDTANSCRVVEVPPSIDVARFREPFKRTVIGPDGERVEVETGPRTPGWVSLGAISKFMEVAVLTTEDGGFYRHHGFDEEAIRNSIRENLRRQKFVRGASTISMQLAKNLYLDRTKNVSRKLQEAVLTSYLEQELTKPQILELYFNVVEFGPMVYGIGPAARHYFNASASELSLGQALYISSILPNPKVQHFGAGGAVGPGWTSYLRKLMELANKRGRIDDSELADGLEETVVRGSPAPHREHPDGDATPAPDPGDPGWLAP